MENKMLYNPVIVKKEVDNTHYYYVDDIFVPSVTRILDETLPMAYGLRRWIGDVGNDFADEKLERAGARGSAIHDACERLLNGIDVNLKEEFPDSKDKKAIVAFVNWVAEFKPIVSATEKVVASTLGYAGTLDIACKISPELIFKLTKFKTNVEDWIIDIKTSSNVYDSHKLQVVGYKEAVYEMTGISANVGILHLNPRTKKGFTFHCNLEIGKKAVTIDDFMAVFNLYKVLNGGVIPEPKEVNVYPDVLSLVEEIK